MPIHDFSEVFEVSGAVSLCRGREAAAWTGALVQELESMLTFEASGLGLDPSRPGFNREGVSRSTSADGRAKVCWELVSTSRGSLWSTLAFENMLASKFSYLARNLFDFRFNSLPRGVTASGNGVELKSAWCPRSWIACLFVSETDTEGPYVWNPNQWLIHFYPSHENKETWDLIPCHDYDNLTKLDAIEPLVFLQLIGRLQFNLLTATWLRLETLGAPFFRSNLPRNKLSATSFCWICRVTEIVLWSFFSECKFFHSYWLQINHFRRKIFLLVTVVPGPLENMWKVLNFESQNNLL